MAENFFYWLFTLALMASFWFVYVSRRDRAGYAGALVSGKRCSRSGIGFCCLDVRVRKSSHYVYGSGSV